MIKWVKLILLSKRWKPQIVWCVGKYIHVNIGQPKNSRMSTNYLQTSHHPYSRLYLHFSQFDIIVMSSSASTCLLGHTYYNY